MHKLRKYGFWIPVLVWMALIFSGSGQVLSFQETSRFLGPLLSWLFPDASPERLRAMMFIIRKFGHLSEYAVLAVLSWWALRRMRGAKDGWSWGDARWALIIVALYAASDEIHQALVPTREGTIRDVLIDTAGGLLGLALVWVVGRVCKRWR